MSRMVAAVENTLLPDFLGQVYSPSVALKIREAMMQALNPEVAGLRDVRVSMSNGSLLLAVEADKCYDVKVSFPHYGLELSACPSQNSPLA